MGEVLRVTIPYCPRPQFQAYHGRLTRWACLVAHRRAGKTVACVNDLIRGALVCEKPEPRFAYLAPLHKQAKDVAWSYLTKYGLAIPGAKAHESELRVDFPNGGRVRLYGADNPDSLRGIYLDGVVLDEYADMRPSVWSEVIRPALSDRQGWATFIGTPKGRNEFASIYDRAKTDPEWFAAMLKASETGLIDAKELEAARRDMSADQYAQEYECSFDAAAPGAYYADQFARIDTEKRIGRVPHDDAVKVDTWWDLGIDDSTAIWFAQRVGAEVHLIDYHEASGEGLSYYASMLQAKAREQRYVYGSHDVPHDAKARELGTGKTRLEVLSSLGVKADVAPDVPVMDGIDAVRNMLGKCWFDAEKCAKGISALRGYRKEWDEVNKVWKSKPRHDWCSHAADAFRCGAVSRPKTGTFAAPIEYPKQPFV